MKRPRGLFVSVRPTSRRLRIAEIYSRLLPDSGGDPDNVSINAV
jgi:hypothetical protein